ncbi:g8874 [Coccomyxa elongata]
MDGFHLTRKQLDNLPNPKEAHQRRGADWTFDADQFVAAVREIRTKGFGCYPSFDHAVGDPVKDDIEVCREHMVVLIEGNYVLLDEAPWRDIRSLVDECWFVECNVEVAMQRVLKRQTANGISFEEASMRVATNDLPNALKIAATSGRADLVLPALPLWRREIC